MIMKPKINHTEVNDDARTSGSTEASSPAAEPAAPPHSHATTQGRHARFASDSLLIELRNLTKTYTEPDGSARTLFDGAAIRLSGANRMYALLGRSGSGKSTLLRILAGLDAGFDGDFLCRGQALPKQDAALAAFRRAHVGVVTQDHALLNDRSVLHNVLVGEKATAANRARALECLAEVGLPDFGAKRPKTLSGGEAQRVAVARAIFRRPALLLADEPTGSLDEASERVILQLFRTLQRQGSTVVIATHSAAVAEACDARLLIQDRKIVGA